MPSERFWSTLRNGFKRVCTLPFLLLVSLFTGAFSGLITACLFRAMAHTPYGAKGENHHG